MEEGEDDPFVGTPSLEDIIIIIIPWEGVGEGSGDPDGGDIIIIIILEEGESEVATAALGGPDKEDGDIVVAEGGVDHITCPRGEESGRPWEGKYPPPTPAFSL